MRKCKILQHPLISEKFARPEMIMQLKEKFDSTVNKSEKVQVLTVLLRSWTIVDIQKEFNAYGRES